MLRPQEGNRRAPIRTAVCGTAPGASSVRPSHDEREPDVVILVDPLRRQKRSQRLLVPLQTASSPRALHLAIPFRSRVGVVPRRRQRRVRRVPAKLRQQVAHRAAISILRSTASSASNSAIRRSLASRSVTTREEHFRAPSAKLSARERLRSTRSPRDIKSLYAVRRKIPQTRNDQPLEDLAKQPPALVRGCMNGRRSDDACTFSIDGRRSMKQVRHRVKNVTGRREDGVF
jgi:hypothetical protein